MKFLYRLLKEIGIDLRKLKNIKHIPRYIKEYILFRGKSKISSLYPCLSDWNEQSGTVSGHYFHQDLLVAQKIFVNRPKNHLDIGSRVDGFVAHVASFRKIDVMDLRPQKNKVENINFIQGDLTNLSKKIENKYDSVSCLHTVEHVGLGRYGDSLDFEGHVKAIKNLKKILSTDGKIYFSVPIGKIERIEFNAHRVFNIRTILKLFDGFKLISFSYIDDKGALHKNIPLNKIDSKSNYNLQWGCGVFEFIKIK